MQVRSIGHLAIHSKKWSLSVERTYFAPEIHQKSQESIRIFGICFEVYASFETWHFAVRKTKHVENLHLWVSTRKLQKPGDTRKNKQIRSQKMSISTTQKLVKRYFSASFFCSDRHRISTFFSLDDSQNPRNLGLFIEENGRILDFDHLIMDHFSNLRVNCDVLCSCGVCRLFEVTVSCRIIINRANLHFKIKVRCCKFGEIRFEKSFKKA